MNVTSSNANAKRDANEHENASQCECEMRDASDNANANGPKRVIDTNVNVNSPFKLVVLCFPYSMCSSFVLQMTNQQVCYVPCPSSVSDAYVHI